MAVRPIRPINVVWEALVAAALLLVLIPPLMGFCVVFLAGLLAVLGEGEPIGWLQWLLIWAAVTGGTLLMGVTVTTLRLWNGRTQPHRKEYRSFTLIRHARHGPLRQPKRTEIDGVEVVSFRLHYLLSARRVPAWWPVYIPKQGEALLVYNHPVYLCALPCRLASCEIRSKSQHWDTSFAPRIFRGRRSELPGELGKHFDLVADRGAESLFADSCVAGLLLDRPDWSVEVRGDRLLAYRICSSRAAGKYAPHTLPADDNDVRFVVKLAQALVEHTRRFEPPIGACE